MSCGPSGALRQTAPNGGFGGLSAVKLCLGTLDRPKIIAWPTWRFCDGLQDRHRFPPGPLEIGLLFQAFEGSHRSQDGTPSKKGDLYCVRFQRSRRRRAEVCCSKAWPLSDLPELACAAAGIHFRTSKKRQGTEAETDCYVWLRDLPSGYGVP